MRLKIADSREVYSFLDKAHLLEPEPVLEGEEWKQSPESIRELDEMKKTCGYLLHCVELPHPLDGITLSFERNGKYYFGSAKLSVRNMAAFRGLSSRIASGLSKENFRFYRTTSKGSGHILDAHNLPLFSIMQTAPHVRDLGMGVYGSIPRKFGDYNDFKKDVQDFEKMINLYASCCLSSAKGIMPPEDITLYIS